MGKTCVNCHFCYEYPDGRKECNNPWRNNPEIKEGGCVGFMPSKTLEECIEKATPALSASSIDLEDLKETCGVFAFWHDAESDDLPPIDEEVIALNKRGRISFAHRPNPEGYDAQRITLGIVEHIDVQTYGKGGWNWDGVRWWMPCPQIPSENE
jgi:hypothetical protein